jgi:tRNA threonylcarbamoyl adenosine modification protein YeaZ
MSRTAQGDLPIDRPLLALDTGSPVASVATVAANGTLLAERSVAQRESSQNLLRLVEEVLAEAGLTLPTVGGIVALQGPGSFTGLRIGMATVQGLSQALGLPATAVPSLHVLAHHAATVGSDREILAVVDAVRGGWFVQAFSIGTGTVAAAAPAAFPVPRMEPERREAAEVPGVAAAHQCTAVWGFGASRLQGAAATGEWPPGLTFHEPPPLAAAGARLALVAPEAWDPHRLTTPLYLAVPAATLPKARRPRQTPGGKG